MAIPVFQSAGTANTAASGTTLAPGYPASIAAGDFLILATVTRAGALTSPSGWTQLETAVTQGTIILDIYTKVASGSESGTLSLTFGSSGVHSSQIIRLTGGSTMEGLATATQGNSTTVAPPSVTTTGSNRLVVSVAAMQSTTSTAAYSGATGGTWVEQATNAAAANDTIQFQTADKAASGTVSGGTETITSGHWISTGFALIGSAGATVVPALTLLGVGV